MTIDLALEYIPSRMNELGYGRNYYIRFRHLVLQADERLEINAYNQFYILVEETDNVLISSDTGIFDLTEEAINEQTYEHQGNIQIVNYSKRIAQLRFIQVIPKHGPKLPGGIKQNM